MKIILNGALGHMGREVDALVKRGYAGADSAIYCDANADIPDVYTKLSDITEQADVIVDFSHHNAAVKLCGYAVARALPVVIATTGHTEDEIAVINTAAKVIPVFMSPNMSAGVAFVNLMVKKAAEFFTEADIEIVERHHNRKLDAPSGTAKMLAETVKSVTGGTIVVGREGMCPRSAGDIGISSVRAANIKGIHEVTFYSANETVSITHTAEDRAMFAEGALKAAAFLMGKAPGIYNMNDLMESALLG